MKRDHRTAVTVGHHEDVLGNEIDLLVTVHVSTHAVIQSHVLLHSPIGNEFLVSLIQLCLMF